MAIRVLAMLSQTCPDARLTMVGPEKDGSLAECQKLVVELGVQDRVTFTGKLSKQEWIDLSKDHDIFLNTTRFDNLPVSLIEAMALGLPIISANVGGIPFLISDGENGLLVADGDVIKMHACIVRLLTDPALRAGITVNGRMHAEQFDWGNIRHKWFSILDKA